MTDFKGDEGMCWKLQICKSDIQEILETLLKDAEIYISR